MQKNTSIEIYAIPVMQYFLVYVPLNSFVSLVDKVALSEIKENLFLQNSLPHPSIKPIIESLHLNPPSFIQPKQGCLSTPLFLGLITTRNCNMGCIYCDFAAPKHTSAIMSLPTAKKAIDAYFDILINNNHHQGQVHFFGGEPFYSPEVVDFAIHYSRMKSEKADIKIEYEVITNGFFDANRAKWIGDTFNTVVLSLDGPDDIQNKNRPGLKGKQSFSQIFEVAKILSASPTNFIVRSCITNETVDRIPEIADWIVRELRPSIWCIEPLTANSFDKKNRLYPPDPWKFAQNFCEAFQKLEGTGIRLVNSTVELDYPQITCCPVGRDALIVSPDSYVDACYLLESDWTAKGMNLRFGKIVEDGQNPIEIDMDALGIIRQLNVYNRPLCRDCFCRYSCAGGCHVNHKTSGRPGDYDDLCIYTRQITIFKLLRALEQFELSEKWLSNKNLVNKSILSCSDRFISQAS